MSHIKEERETVTKLMKIIEENLKKSYPRVLIGDELIEVASRTLGREVSHEELDEAMEALVRKGCVREVPGARDLH
jgi:hypothetical protein